ncbi:MAG: hypothetical protein FJY85_23490, partial [Deltaproteobacteria bacterium]|nr:hypothetical protein [Deltaproteobacteria bacterium]
MKLDGNILLGGNASFVLNYGLSNPGTEYTMEVGKLSSNSLVNCDFQLDGRADDGEPGAMGENAGDAGGDGGNGSAGKSGYVL